MASAVMPDTDWASSGNMQFEEYLDFSQATDFGDQMFISGLADDHLEQQQQGQDHMFDTVPMSSISPPETFVPCSMAGNSVDVSMGLGLGFGEWANDASAGASGGATTANFEMHHNHQSHSLESSNLQAPTSNHPNLGLGLGLGLGVGVEEAGSEMDVEIEMATPGGGMPSSNQQRCREQEQGQDHLQDLAQNGQQQHQEQQQQEELDIHQQHQHQHQQQPGMGGLSLSAAVSASDLLELERITLKSPHRPRIAMVSSSGDLSQQAKQDEDQSQYQYQYDQQQQLHQIQQQQQNTYLQRVSPSMPGQDLLAVPISGLPARGGLSSNATAGAPTTTTITATTATSPAGGSTALPVNVIMTRPVGGPSVPASADLAQANHSSSSPAKHAPLGSPSGTTASSMSSFSSRRLDFSRRFVSALVSPIRKAAGKKNKGKHGNSSTSSASSDCSGRSGSYSRTTASNVASGSALAGGAEAAAMESSTGGVAIAPPAATATSASMVATTESQGQGQAPHSHHNPFGFSHSHSHALPHSTAHTHTPPHPHQAALADGRSNSTGLHPAATPSQPSSCTTNSSSNGSMSNRSNSRQSASVGINHAQIEHTDNDSATPAVPAGPADPAAASVVSSLSPSSSAVSMAISDMAMPLSMSMATFPASSLSFCSGVSAAAASSSPLAHAQSYHSLSSHAQAQAQAQAQMVHAGSFGNLRGSSCSSFQEQERQQQQQQLTQQSCEDLQHYKQHPLHPQRQPVAASSSSRPTVLYQNSNISGKHRHTPSSITLQQASPSTTTAAAPATNSTTTTTVATATPAPNSSSCKAAATVATPVTGNTPLSVTPLNDKEAVAGPSSLSLALNRHAPVATSPGDSGCSPLAQSAPAAPNRGPSSSSSSPPSVCSPPSLAMSSANAIASATIASTTGTSTVAAAAAVAAGPASFASASAPLSTTASAAVVASSISTSTPSSSFPAPLENSSSSSPSSSSDPAPASTSSSVSLSARPRPKLSSSVSVSSGLSSLQQSSSLSTALSPSSSTSAHTSSSLQSHPHRLVHHSSVHFPTTAADSITSLQTPPVNFFIDPFLPPSFNKSAPSSAQASSINTGLSVPAPNMVDYQPLQSRSNSMFDSDSIDPLALTSPTPRRAMTMSISGPSLGAGLGSGVADMASSVRDPTVVWPMTSAGAENTMLWSVYGNDATAVHDNNMWALNMMQQQSQDGQGSADGAEHSSFTDATAHYTFQQPSHHPQTVSPHDLSHNELTEYPGLAADGSMIHNSHMMLDPSAGHTANPYENNGIGSINGPLAHHFINPTQTQHVMTQAPQLVAAPAPAPNDQQQRRRQPRAPSSSMRHMHSLPVMSSRKQRPNRSESPGSGSGAPGSGSGAHGHGHGPAPGHSRTLSGSASIPPHAIRKKRSVSRTLARSASNGSIDFGGSSAGLAMSVSMNQLASANVPTAGAGTMSHNVQNMQNVQAVQAVQNVQSVQNTINTNDGYNGLLSQQSSQSSHSGYSVQNGHHSSNSHDQSNNSSQSSSSNSSSNTTGGISFMNYTPKDGHILMTGVAPSGSSKTKAKREREAIERQRRLSEAARRAVMAAGGDPGQIEGWIKVSDDESPPAAAEVHIKSPDPDSESEGK